MQISGACGNGVVSPLRSREGGRRPGDIGHAHPDLGEDWALGQNTSVGELPREFAGEVPLEARVPTGLNEASATGPWDSLRGVKRRVATAQTVWLVRS